MATTADDRFRVHENTLRRALKGKAAGIRPADAEHKIRFKITSATAGATAVADQTAPTT